MVPHTDVPVQAERGRVMDTPATAGEQLGDDAARTAGWIVSTPDGQPYMWYRHGWRGCTDSAAALALFEASPEQRTALITAGWSARKGSATEFYAPRAERISA